MAGSFEHPKSNPQLKRYNFVYSKKSRYANNSASKPKLGRAIPNILYVLYIYRKISD